MVFGAKYASVYDALYADKNYLAEVQFVLDQLRSVLPEAPRRILDLGCGTGLHAVQMARAGISITGVDRSADMIAVAKIHRETLPHEEQKHVHLKIGDIRSIDFHCRFDAVISLFHVMSYVIEEESLQATMQTARRHLSSGGAFLFDFWYGPAVLRAPPQTREKITQIGGSCIRRRTFPEWEPERHIVCVNYEIEIKDSASGNVVREQEQHFIRYFFPDELGGYLHSYGFEVVRFGEAFTGRPVSNTTFSVYALARLR